MRLSSTLLLAAAASAQLPQLPSLQPDGWEQDLWATLSKLGHASRSSQRKEKGSLPPACILAPKGIVRWTCGLVGQLPLAGFILVPDDSNRDVWLNPDVFVPGDEERPQLTVLLKGFEVMGVTASHITSNASDDGLRAGLAGLGWQAHISRLEAGTNHCPFDSCATSVALPSWAPTLEISRRDFDLLRGTAATVRPDLGLDVRAEGLSVSLLLEALRRASFPPSLRAPELEIQVPPRGWSISAYRDSSFGTLQANLQPFVEVVLYFLHDVLVPAVSRSAAAFLAQSSGRVAEWAGERMRLSGAECAARPSCGAVPFLARGTWLSTALTHAVPVGLLLPPRGPLREPASPFPADQTVRFGAVGALRALNAEGGVFATGSLLRRLMRSTGGWLRFTKLDQLPIVRRLPALSLGESSLRVTPASLTVGGLDTVSRVRLLDPSGGFSLAAGVDMGRLSLALRLQLELRLPLSPWRGGGTGGADRPLLYHTTDAPLTQELELSVTLSNLSTALLAAVPLSTGALAAADWLTRPPRCLLAPLRAVTLREVRLLRTLDSLRIASVAEGQEVEARLYDLLTAASGYFADAYLPPSSAPRPDVLDALVRGPLRSKANELLPRALDALTQDCAPAPREAAPPAPVAWSRVPLAHLLSAEATPQLANTLARAAGLDDARIDGVLLSLSSDRARELVGTVRVEISDLRLRSLDKLSELSLLATNASAPHELRNVIGGAGSVGFTVALTLCRQECTTHAFEITLSLASVRLVLDLDVAFLQPFPQPAPQQPRDGGEGGGGKGEAGGGAGRSPGCVLHSALRHVRLLGSTRLEVANWTEAELDLAVRALDAPSAAHVPTEWLFWAVSAFGRGGLRLANDALARGLELAGEACAAEAEAAAPSPSSAAGEGEGEEGRALSPAAAVTVLLYGSVVLVAGGVVGWHLVRRQGVPASGVDASLAAARPIWHALLMTAVCVCVMGMLTVYASPGAFATSSVGLSLAGHELPRVQVMQIELPEIVLMLWDAEAYPLMAVAGFSMGSWPFIKLLLTLFSLWAPASVLPPARRGRLLLWFDLLGKVSLFDILFEYILLAVFALVSADLPTLPELRHDSCGRTVPFAHFALDVHFTWRTWLFITATAISLLCTNVVNHWHQLALLSERRDFARRVAGLVAERCSAEATTPFPVQGAEARSMSPALSTPPPRRRSLSAHSLEPAARQASARLNDLLAKAGAPAPPGGSGVRRLELQSRSAALVTWSLVLAIGLTLAAYVSESFQLTFEGAVAEILEAQPGGTRRNAYSLYSMTIAIGEAVGTSHMCLFALMCGAMPLLWLALCLWIWRVPMERHTSHAFAFVAQTAYCYSAFELVVVVIVMSMFEIGPVVEAKLAHVVGPLDWMVAHYFADFYPETTVSHTHTTLSLSAGFEPGMALMALAVGVSYCAGGFVMVAHHRLLHEQEMTPQMGSAASARAVGADEAAGERAHASLPERSKAASFDAPSERASLAGSRLSTAMV